MDCSTNQYCSNNNCKTKSDCPHPCCPANDKNYYPKNCSEGYDCIDYKCNGGNNKNSESKSKSKPPYAKITCLPATDQSPAKLSLQIKTYTGSNDVSAELTIYLPDGVEKHGTKGAFTCTQSICTTKKMDIPAGDVRELVLEVQSNKPDNYNLFSGEILWKWKGSIDDYNTLPLDTSKCNIFVASAESVPPPEQQNKKWWENPLFIIAIIGVIILVLIYRKL